MNILIIENDIYLAQKIVSRLLDDGHSCVCAETSNAICYEDDFDIVLLSTSMPNVCYGEIIKRYENAISLLLVSYISDETVTDPIKEGAKDYIMKPFIMDELLRKIYHYKNCKELRSELNTMRNYLEFIFKDIHIPKDQQHYLELPLLVETNSQKCVDKIAFDFAKKLKLPIRFISLCDDNWQKEIQQSKNELLYLTNYHALKKLSKEMLNDLIEDKKAVVCSLECESDFPFYKSKIENSDMVVINDNIMTINDYVKLMVTSFQNKYPDTELSKKLGISRKSLWEKRKKLGIEKKK
jgi:DNA-binding NtrC family response regulator